MSSEWNSLDMENRESHSRIPWLIRPEWPFDPESPQGLPSFPAMAPSDCGAQCGLRCASSLVW